MYFAVHANFRVPSMNGLGLSTTHLACNASRYYSHRLRVIV
jgi:hypothetical protein